MATIREILVVPHTHHDIGYTHLPSECIEAHVSSVGEAMRLCEAGLGDDSPDAFRWTFELSRPVLTYLEQAPENEAERMRQLVASGRLAVTAGYLHMTQLVGNEEAIRAFWPVDVLRERFGLYPSIVQHGDINGLPWGTVPLMSAMGLDALVMALNPDHGRAPFEQPSAFFWEGPDGSRILVWLSVHYALGRLAEGHIDQAQEALPPLIARLAERDDYPFDFLIVHAARDNMWPDPRVTSGVRLWNAQGHTPPMRIATIDDAIARAKVVAKRGALPTVRGEWADWWAHGHGSSAYEVGLGRAAQVSLRLAEMTHAVSQIAKWDGADRRAVSPPGSGAPVIAWYNTPIHAARARCFTDRVERAYDDLLLWEEHTWGSFQSVTSPASPFTRAHWNEKAGFGYRSFAESRELARDAAEELVAALPAGEPALMVINPLSRQRDDFVSVATEQGPAALVVRGIPPLGVKVVPVPATAPALLLQRSPVLENRFYRIEVDPTSAAIVSLYDKALEKEWVDAEASHGLAAVIYEEADPADDHPALTDTRRHFHPDTPGPRFLHSALKGTGDSPLVLRQDGSVRLTMEGAAPNLPHVRTTVTLYDELNWIDIGVHVQKQESDRMEGVYVAFPFALDDPTFLIESTNAVFDPASEQLPDTCRDWYSVQRAVGITTDANAILWATREAPLVQLGAIRTGAWSQEYHPKKGHLFSWLMNNLYFTNFKATQGGEFNASYRFSTRPGRLEASDVQAWGDAFAAPAFGVVAPVAIGDYQWLSLTPASVLGQIVTPPSGEEGLLIRLRETSGRPAVASMAWLGPGEIDVLPANLFGRPVGQRFSSDGQRVDVPLRARELAAILVRRR